MPPKMFRDCKVFSGLIAFFFQLLYCPLQGRSQRTLLVAFRAPDRAGDQFIDLKAAQKVLFGRFGICRPTVGQPRKLALPIQVTYTKGQFESEPSKPCISSGRHRLMSLLILLSAAGFTDYEIDEIPVRITSCVVTSNEDFAMIMENMLMAEGYFTAKELAKKFFTLYKLSRDLLGTYICAGVFTMLLWQVFQNVGMTLGIMPVTGLPLPFISYGGSSLLVYCAMFGAVQSVYMRRLR